MAKEKTEKTAKEILKEAEIPIAEQPYEIPSHWTWAYIGKLSSVISGGTPKTSKNEYYENGDIPWLTPADLSGYDDIYIGSGRKFITEEGLKNSSAKMLPKDSILFSSRAPIGYVAIAQNEVSTNQGFKSFPPSKCYIPHYGYWYLKFAKDLAESMASGTTFAELSGKKAALIPIPIPPIHEQEDIVRKMESMLGKIHEARELISEAKESFQNRRAAILAKAFRGELTAQWREQNPNQDSVEELFDTAKNNKIKKTKIEYSFDRPYAIPESWMWTTIGEILDLSSGGTPSRKNSDYYEGEIPWIKTGEIWWNKIFESEEHISQLGLDNSSAKLFPPETVLVAMYGQGLTRGRAAILKKAATTNQAICALLPSESINNQYLFYYFMEGYHRFRRWAKGGNQENFSAKMIASFPFPLPPFSEQLSIVKKLQTILEQENSLLELLNIEEDIDILEKSMLSQAFQGQLTSQPIQLSFANELKNMANQLIS